MNKDPLANQLIEMVNTVIYPLESSGVDIIDPAHVAAEVDKNIDPSSLSPELKTYASIMQIRQVARSQLAKRHDPVKKAEEFVEGADGDLFGDVLQDRYPVKRKNENNETHSVYLRRGLMSERDINAVCSRMEKAGNSLIQHVDALKAWWRSFGEVGGAQ